MSCGRFIAACALTLVFQAVTEANGNTVDDTETNIRIVAPTGILVTPNVGGVPEWHFSAMPSFSGMPALGLNEDVLCALQLSASPRVGGKTDPAYLKEEVDGHMRSLGALDPTSVFEPSRGRFLMVSEWNPTQGDDSGNTIFMFHAETDSVYAYMSCVTKSADASAAKPVFRAIWNGIELYK